MGMCTQSQNRFINTNTWADMISLVWPILFFLFACHWVGSMSLGEKGLVQVSILYKEKRQLEHGFNVRRSCELWKDKQINLGLSYNVSHLETTQLANCIVQGYTHRL